MFPTLTLTQRHRKFFQNNNAWIKQIVKFGRIEIEPEADIGSKRTRDLLITILNYPRKGKQKVVIEVENDRKFDAAEILRKFKRDKRYPTIVIIPREFERNARTYKSPPSSCGSFSVLVSKF